MIQRWQLNRRRNVGVHLTEEYREQVGRRLAAAYSMTTTADAKRALEKLHRQLQELNPAAARSLAEGNFLRIKGYRDLPKLLACSTTSRLLPRRSSASPLN